MVKILLSIDFTIAEITFSMPVRIGGSIADYDGDLGAIAMLRAGSPKYAG
jgi:hypothetical protein